MYKGIVFAAGLAAVLFATAASAQMDEIVVTGARIAEYDATSVPHVVLVKRADFLITRVRVSCDTRDAKQRRTELETTLRSMIRAARGSSIKLSVEQDDIITDFDETKFDTVIGPDTRPDTSVVGIIVKTAISKDDTYENATARIKAFVKATPLSGRTEILGAGASWDLTIVGPEQYRTTLIKKIAQDSNDTVTAFGGSYGISVQGLQRPIEWYQSAPLDLSLFIRYTLTMEPATR